MRHISIIKIRTKVCPNNSNKLLSIIKYCFKVIISFNILKRPKIVKWINNIFLANSLKKANRQPWLLNKTKSVLHYYTLHVQITLNCNVFFMKMCKYWVHCDMGHTYLEIEKNAFQRKFADKG